ncbi:DUF1330 domain-containing protein [Acidovorax sp. NCPPB 3576]|uniref:DUF1330 domain-containing protein n=1 Tax=Acidovorax sp. NCPPB 3576 TaxID=2940488 RepID=UPI00234966F9|nr:DUF1330 domain-containing protein [Acidovorax sp. NCPPB 3576]WCM88385.1 DUF1330 domain-containing protein [Acidovorax sp. NCPPB 3576]
MSFLPQFPAAAMACIALCSLTVQPSHAQAPAAKAPAYYLSEFEVTDVEGIKPYSAQVEATFKPFGGHYIARGGQVRSLEGEAGKRIVMIAFPSLAQAQAWYDSPAYREIRPIRLRSATSRVYVVEGVSAP